MRQDAMRSGIMREILVCTADGFRAEPRELAEECAHRVNLNGSPCGLMHCSPWELREAVIGNLYLRGLIGSAEDILALQITEDEITVNAKNEPAVQNADWDGTVYAGDIISLAQQLEERSRLFRRTGGVHSAALARGSEISVYCEDVSRHTAVDKVAGTCLLHGIPMQGSVLVFSGRVPTEIIERAAKMGCAAIVARSAPTDYACRLAEAYGITLIGFARDETFNIYTCPARVRR